MAVDALERFGVNDRSHIGCDVGGVAHHQFLGRALQHLDYAIGYRLVHAQQAQSRTALPGRPEGALHHGIDHLLGQG